MPKGSKTLEGLWRVGVAPPRNFELAGAIPDNPGASTFFFARKGGGAPFSSTGPQGLVQIRTSADILKNKKSCLAFQGRVEAFLVRFDFGARSTRGGKKTKQGLLIGKKTARGKDGFLSIWSS